MTDPELRPTPATERPNRRATDGTTADTPRARQRRLVRHIAADPDLVAWLGVTKARTLHEAASALADAGMRDAAEYLHGQARRFANGEVSPF